MQRPPPRRFGIAASTSTYLLTVGIIADRLGEPIHRIEHVLRTRNIRPLGIAGHSRVYDKEALDRIADELRAIDDRKDGAE